MGYVNYTGGRFVLGGGAPATIKMGPFIDISGDIVTGLTINQADVKLSKNDGVIDPKNDAGAAVDQGDGWYNIPINTTDTGTIGNLLVMIEVAGALPVWRMLEVKDSPQ